MPDPDALLAFDSCTIELDGVQCDECEICESGIGATFDCSNVNIFGFLNGPDINTCVGLGIFSDLDADPGSLASFGEPV